MFPPFPGTRTGCLIFGRQHGTASTPPPASAPTSPSGTPPTHRVPGALLHLFGHHQLWKQRTPIQPSRSLQLKTYRSPRLLRSFEIQNRHQHLQSPPTRAKSLCLEPRYRSWSDSWPIQSRLMRIQQVYYDTPVKDRKRGMLDDLESLSQDFDLCCIQINQHNYYTFYANCRFPSEPSHPFRK